MTRFAQRFVLEREIGAGGMARVFLGKDAVLERFVAIKILNPFHGGTDISARFRREGRTAARLSHPNIVSVYDAGEDEFEGREVSYIVMEYVSGGDLKALLDGKGSLPNAELARLGAEVSSGLAHAHDKGVIHRDIKPHNILVDDYGQPKLTDFGIARALDATEATRTGSYLGTALYSAPEQLRGERVTPKSDVYSLGVTLYQAAVGETPFTGTPIEVASQHVSRMPTEPGVLGARLSNEVETLILDCLHKDPDQRPSVEEVHERLQEARPDRIVRAPAISQISEPPPLERTQEVPPEESSEYSPVERTRTDTRAESPGSTPSVSPTPADPPTNKRATVAASEVPTAGPPPDGERREDGGDRRRRKPVLFAAAALLLIALGVTAAFAMLGNTDLTQNLPVNQQASSSGDGGQEATSAGEGSSPVQEQAADDPATEASQTIKDYFATAASANYEDSWNFLSPRYQQQIGSRENLTGQFQTLKEIDFTSGPAAQVSDDTATVSFGTIAYHTDRTDRRTGTATLVRENNGWKIDNLSVQNA